MDLFLLSRCLNHIIASLLLIILIVYASSVSSEPLTTINKKSALDTAAETFSNKSGFKKAHTNDKKNESIQILPNILCSDINDEVTRNHCWKAYQSGLNYFHDGLEHRKNVFRWQYISSQIIFFVVLALVVIGIYFAWVQFKIDINIKEEKSDKDHSVEVSTSGIKVSSPVLGVIILALSLAFFYLYLAFVYPITEIF